MRSFTLIISVLFLSLLMGFTDVDRVKKKKSQHKNFHFEPEESTITGTLSTQEFFGPPGYGETPETDTRETAYILTLDETINVLSKEKNSSFNYSRYGVKKVQVTTELNLDKLVNKKVKLTGTFFGAHTGHHHTDVLLWVEKAEEVQ